ncbi:retrovirus-related pol polyprotein from transposon TNT 1-94 [Tanacetum coccineum]
MRLIQSLASKELVRNLPKLKFDQHFCDACKMGKQAHAGHKAKNIVSTTRCLKLLHMDLFGPSAVQSYGGNRYTLVIVDDYARYTWTRFLKNKTESFDQFKIFSRKIQNQLGCSIVSIRTDHGREFDNEVQFGEFCNASGITHNFSALRTPQSNGVVKRKNRTLQEMSRTMLNEQSLPQKFWCNAVDTSTYILNSILIRAILGKTPYKLLRGRKPTLLPNSKAYIIFNKHTKKIKESLHVTFDETPPPSKTSPLVDDDLDEEEAIKVLVAQGYNQQEGIDYDETYAPVARLESIRILLAYSYALDFKLFQMDVKSAFLNGFINEEVYVAQPLGFIDFKKPDHVYKLKKALYGLKQAPKAWYDRLKAFLIKHEYKMGMVDNTLFTKKKSSNLIIVQIYVDDIIFGSTCQDMCDEFAKIMHDEFEMSMMGELNFFLGLQIKQMKYGIFFNQSKYIKEMLKKFGLEDSKPMKTPMSFDTKLMKDEECESVDSTKYRGMIGLLYPKGSGIETVVYADSDHARDYVDRKSTSGIYTFVGCCLTSWFSKKQTALAISTTEAEYVSAEKACQQALWMKQALIDYDKEVNEIHAEKIDKNANPLTLVAAAQQYPDNYYQASKPQRSYAPSLKQSSHASTRYKGKKIAKPITPPSKSAFDEDNTSSRYKNDNQTGQFGNQRTMTVVGARETVGSQVVQQTGIQYFNCKEFGHFTKEYKKPKRQADCLEETDEEIDEQELEAHYIFMANIQLVLPVDSDINDEPLEKVQYDDEYNVFANERQYSEQHVSINNTCVVEKVDSNVIPNSSDMCDNDDQTDKNTEE